MNSSSNMGKIIRYRKWFLHGTGAKPGYRTLVNKWLLLHSIIGALLAYFLPFEISSAASAVLLPLAGVLVGLSIAWAGVAYSLLQSSEIARLAEHNPGGLDDYVFTYETSILSLLSTLVGWGLAGLQIFDKVAPTANHFKMYLIVKWILFTMTSIAIRECWQVVHYCHVFLRLQAVIKTLPKADKDPNLLAQRQVSIR